MAQDVPPWLNSSFLSSALKCEVEDVNSEVIVVAFTTSPAVQAGENYAGTLYRVQVEFRVGEQENKSTSLIVKIPPTKGAIFDLLDESGVFNVEPEVYGDMLPKLHKLVNHQFGPKVYPNSVKNVLVLKDMKDIGYVKCDTIKKIDFQHCKLVVKTLAKYHAASVTYSRDKFEFVDKFCTEKLFTEGKSFSEGFKPWLENSVEVAIETLSEVDESKVQENYVRSRFSHISESVLNVCKPKSKGLNVINHGDLWINNMLFQYTDSEEVKDVKFIDFQVPRYGSPVIDLIYFIWASADDEVRERRLQELHDIYLEDLNATLQQLGSEERYSEGELQQDLKQASDWGVYVICAELPLMMSEPDNALVAEETSSDDYKSKETLRHLQSNKHYRSLLPRILRQFNKWYSTF